MKWSQYRAEHKYNNPDSQTSDKTKNGWLIFLLYATWVITILLDLYSLLEWCEAIDDFVFFLVLIMFIWIIIPCVIIWIVGFVMSWFQKEKAWKGLRWAGIAAILLLVSTCYSPNGRDIADYMAKTYEQHEADMKELIRYTSDACDSNCHLRLEWEHGTLGSSSSAYKATCSHTARGKSEIMQMAGITREEFETIRKLVKRCNCIGIEIDKRIEADEIDEYGRYNRVAHTINFQRRGMGLYSFMLYDKAQLEEVTSTFGRPIRYNDSTFFLFEGGAIGPQDWDDDYRKEKEHQFLEKQNKQ